MILYFYKWSVSRMSPTNHAYLKFLEKGVLATVEQIETETQSS